MLQPRDWPLVSPLVVGREPQLAVLHRLVEEMQAGQGRAVIISGEAGIGKTRLIAEVRVHAEGRGARVCRGACFEADRERPYAPLLDLLSALSVGPNPLPGRLAGDAGAPLPADLAADLAQLLSALAASPRHPSVATSVPPATSADPEEVQRRLFDAAERFFVRLAEQGPLVVVVEDLHWGDEATLDFLPLLARLTTARPILLGLTYRSEEVQAHLRELLVLLNRERLAAELPLPRLAPAEVETMLRALCRLSRPIRAPFLGRICELTEGNPFFIEEVVRSLLDGNAGEGSAEPDRLPVETLRIPRTVRDAVLQRAERLSATAREVAVLAAVAGRRFDFPLLQELTGLSERDLLAALKELIAAHLVSEEPADLLAFRHALTRQALYADLLERERRMMHGQVARAIERVHAGALDLRVADLAAHFHAAGAWEQALVYGRRAAEHALAMHAPRATVEHCCRAVDAAIQLGTPVPAALYRARGLAYETLGDFERARADYDAALAAAMLAGDRLVEWRALLDLGLLWAESDYVRTGEYVQRALDVAHALGDPALVGHSLNRVGNWHMNAGRTAEAVRSHEDALRIFEGRDDARGVAETLDLLGMASIQIGDSVASFSYYSRALPLLRALDDRQRLVTALVIRVLQSGFYWSDTMAPAPMARDEAERDGEGALRIAREIGWRAGESFVLWELAEWLGPRGSYGQALANAHAGLVIAEEIGHQQWIGGAHCTLGALYLDLLATPAAQDHLERALTLARAIGSTLWAHIAAALLAATYLRRRHFTEAAAVLDAALDPDSVMESMGQRMCWCTRAELALARGHPSPALVIIDRLIATAANLEGGAVIPRLWKLRGEAVGALGKPLEAAELLRAARAAAQQQGLLPALWRIEASLGRIEWALGHRTDARRSFSAARSVVEQLAGAIPDAALRDGFLHGASELLPAARPPSQRSADKAAAGGLTVREREVAALIAAGRSNRAAAEALVVSERTVEGYVAAIMAKLGFASRAQIAAWAVERRLTGDQGGRPGPRPRPAHR